MKWRRNLDGRTWPIAAAVLLAHLLSWAPAIMARDLDFCSTLNTGGSANMSIYQTVGLCYDFCVGEYAYAILNYQSCWCSDWAPAQSTEVSLTNCNIACPGYPDESCGGRNNLFGYVALGMNPSGTSTPPGASTQANTPTQAVTTTVHNIITILSSSTPTQATPTTVLTAEPGSNIGTGSTGTATSATPTVTSVTTDGIVRTVTATPTTEPTGASSADTQPTSSSSSRGLNTGQVVGVVIGAIAGVAILAVIIACLIMARRKRNASANGSQNGGPGGNPRSDMGESATSTFSPLSGRWGQSGPSAGSRLSEMDPRMDPLKPGLYARNMSHESINTMRDEQDYSRPVHQPKVLRATNPDPEADE